MISMRSSGFISEKLLAYVLSVQKSTLLKWEKNGELIPNHASPENTRYYKTSQLLQIEEVKKMVESDWDKEINIKPMRAFTSIELFAGAGGLALGLEKAGFNTIALNESDGDSCSTIRANRPDWNIIEGDIKNLNFAEFEGTDFVSGGFPCQSFSFAGKKLSFKDTRGALFFEFVRAIKEIKPKVFLGENVRGLVTNDSGNTLAVIKSVLSDLGYTLIEPKVLKALFYKVPQKRERLFLIGIRNDLTKFAKFKWPSPYYKIYVLRDALKASELYDTDVPESQGLSYTQRRREILSLVPPGGNWKNLPRDVRKEYAGRCFSSSGSTGMARRLSWDEPSLTITCHPAQKLTERCHPDDTRPLTVRECARVQTFPDDWYFLGSVSSQYKQIGNAVPVNLAHAIGRSLIALLNSIEAKDD